MRSGLLLFVLGTLLGLVHVSQPSSFYHQYIVVGAGPSGLQLGHFLQKADRDYVVLERSNISGNFFSTYPRHDKLISINKRNTGKTNKEFNLRHDWNSLLSDDESLLYKHYSKEFFPHRKTILKYLDDYTRKLNINIQYNTNIGGIHKVYNESLQDELFQMTDQDGNLYICQTLLLATGMWMPKKPQFEGAEFVEDYDNISVNPDEFEGQNVLILGRGNAAFEVADNIYGSTNVIHMMARSRVRLSWATHYVGDLRAVNNGLLDTYQLKSLDGLLEASVEELKLVKLSDGKLYVRIADASLIDGQDFSAVDEFDNFALRDGYDRVIRCLGFTFDDSVFTDPSTLSRGEGSRKKKFPRIEHDYESPNYKNMFIAGTASHSLDFRKSAGGFIHGFRYTARSLHRILEWRNHKVPWPTTRYKTMDLLSAIIKRINEASGTYQMFSVLGDVIAIRNDGEEVDYIEEFPIKLLAEFTEVTGHTVGPVIVIVMEYGPNFSGPANDIFSPDRATGEPSEAHTSNFLHPVFYYYKQLPSKMQMADLRKQQTLPRPDRIHHVVEDFLTNWDAPTSHILPLRRFLENVLDRDLRLFFAEDCFKLAMTLQTVPDSCKNLFLQGQGSFPTPDLQAKTLGIIS